MLTNVDTLKNVESNVLVKVSILLKSKGAENLRKPQIADVISKAMAERSRRTGI